MCAQTSFKSRGIKSFAMMLSVLCIYSCTYKYGSKDFFDLVDRDCLREYILLQGYLENEAAFQLNDLKKIIQQKKSDMDLRGYHRLEKKHARSTEQIESIRPAMQIYWALLNHSHEFKDREEFSHFVSKFKNGIRVILQTKPYRKEYRGHQHALREACVKKEGKKLN